MKNLFIKKYVNNNDKSSAFGKTYGRAVMLGTCDIEELASEIQASCTATRADILAVLSALGQAISNKLQSSQRVRIPYLGTFKLGVTTKGEVNAADFSVQKNVLAVRVLFKPETKIENGHRVSEMTRGARVAELPKNISGIATDDTDTSTDGTNTGTGGTGTGGTSQDDPIENRP